MDSMSIVSRLLESRKQSKEMMLSEDCAAGAVCEKKLSTCEGQSRLNEAVMSSICRWFMKILKYTLWMFFFVALASVDLRVRRAIAYFTRNTTAITTAMKIPLIRSTFIVASGQPLQPKSPVRA